MPLDLSCVDWEERLLSGRSLVPDGARHINDPLTDRLQRIFDMLVLPDVPTMPQMREAAGEWFRELVGIFLGAISPVTRERLIRELFLLAAKKNSKTSYGAGMMMTALVANERPYAEFLLIAPTHDISELAFNQAQGMVENDPEGFLQVRFKPRPHIKTITDLKTRAHLKIKTFDESVLTGVKPVGVLLDELHEISRNPRALRILAQIRGGLLPFPEAFLAIITTQSSEPPAGAFKAELKLARRIRDGKAKGSVMPVLYEFPLSMQRDKKKPPAWQDPTNWPLVLPNLGRSITLPRLQQLYDEEREKGDESLRIWASQHLNIEIGIAMNYDGWEGADYWLGSTDESIGLDALIDRCEVITIGIDGGGLDDLLSLTVMGREKGTRNWLSWSDNWVHRKVFEKREEIGGRLQDFSDAGELTIVDHMPDAFVALAETCEYVKDTHKLWQIGVDPQGVSLIIDALAKVGIEGQHDVGNGQQIPWIIGISQSWKLNGAIKATAVKLSSGELWHADQDITAWAVSNAKIEPRGNAVSITKQLAGLAKIDPLMSFLDAAAIMGTNPRAMVETQRQLLFI